MVSFLTQKSTDSVSFSTTFERIVFSVFTRQIHSFFGYSPLLAWGWGQKLAKFAVFLVAKILKMHIFLTFLNGYIHPNNFKNKKQALGLCPKPHSHLRGRRGRWQTLSTYPYGECWVDSKASRVKMHDFVALDPSPSPWGSKTNRSGRSWKPVKACEATA